MKKCRIIKRTYCNNTSYVIQQKHLIFRWWWVDASTNSLSTYGPDDTFDSFIEAKANLCQFSGTCVTEEVIEQYQFAGVE